MSSASPPSSASGLRAPGGTGWLRAQGLLPVACVLTVLMLLWYALAIALNAPGAIERHLGGPDAPWTATELVQTTWSMARPILPAPHQIAQDTWHSLLDWPIDHPRSLIFHARVTAEATLLGFVLGALLGALLAIGIVHSVTLERALMPWIVASQTVPVLAIAPIVLVVLGSLGFTGVLPKAVIAMYLCFFPVTVAMVQGLRAPQAIERELLHTYAATRWQGLWLLRLPSALPYLFPALRVAVAAGLVGAIVAELPTGAQAGLGARLLTSSYDGNTVQIWSALLMATVLGVLLTTAVSGLERLALRHRGAVR
ncbi:ABC transporter permease [Aquabacterium sp. UBA2148]|uniref:ABC transporter permease n=1 Tax=Aquabacterium sp. UBA2148 TaxID=1946042 RepID=UPI00257A8943|nr:ABC transporter permease [Aquabacterium sp. UBA2148]